MTAGQLKQLLTNARPLFDNAQWTHYRELFRKGIEAGAYGTDQHGVPTLERCVRTGIVLLEKTGLKKASLLTALFDPMIQHGVIGLEDLDREFDEDTAGLMRGMYRVKELYSKHDSIADENFRKLLVSFAEDIRVIICLIADRYVLMLMLGDTEDTDYRLHVTEECRLLYTPMAHRLGLYAIKSELEDMAVKYEHRDVYNDIARQLNETKRAREAYIQSFIGPVRQRLEEAGLKFTIKGRTKSISSIWAKMKAQNTTVETRLTIQSTHAHRFIRIDKRSNFLQASSIFMDRHTQDDIMCSRNQFLRIIGSILKWTFIAFQDFSRRIVIFQLYRRMPLFGL